MDDGTVVAADISASLHCVYRISPVWFTEISSPVRSAGYGNGLSGITVGVETEEPGRVVYRHDSDPWILGNRGLSFRSDRCDETDDAVVTDRIHIKRTPVSRLPILLFRIFIHQE